MILQVPGSDNAGLRSDILEPELMSEGKETLLEKKKANVIMLGLALFRNFQSYLINISHTQCVYDLIFCKPCVLNFIKSNSLEISQLSFPAAPSVVPAGWLQTTN